MGINECLKGEASITWCDQYKAKKCTHFTVSRSVFVWDFGDVRMLDFECVSDKERVESVEFRK